MSRQLVRSALRSVAARVYYASIDSLSQLTGRVVILTYHRVIPPSELETTFVQPGMYVTPETFARHLQFLTSHFNVVSLQDLLANWRNNTWDAGARYCTITFDDGWLDNYLYAYPLLRQYRAPATIFLPTDLIGTRKWLWSDRLGYLLHHQRSRDIDARPEVFDSLVERAKTLSEENRNDLLNRLGQSSAAQVPGDRRFIDWEEAREMSNDGIAFGSHTCTHASLDRLDRHQLQRELQQSFDVLLRQAVNFVPVLSYPYGEYTDFVLSEARAAGYEAAVTTHAGLESNRPGDVFRLKRIGVHDDVSRTVPLLTFHIGRCARSGKDLS